MVYFDLDYSITDENELLGIKNRINNVQIIDNKYAEIEVIPHFTNASLQVIEEVFVLFINETQAHFCRIKDDVAIISDRIYNGLSLEYFYQGLTICCIDDEYYIIDIEDNIIKGPLNSNAFDAFCDNPMELNDLVNVDDIMKNLNGENYGFTRDTDDKGFIGFRNEYLLPWKAEQIFCHLFSSRMDSWNLKFDLSNFSSNYFEKLSDFNYDNGTCLARLQNKVFILNRYFYPIGGPFDDVFNDLLALPLNPNISVPNQTCHYETEKNILQIANGNKYYKIRLKGNFIKEYFEKPYLFLKYNSTLKYIAGIERPEIEEQNNYFKIDEIVLQDYIQDQRNNNPNFTEEDINQFINSQEFIDTVCQFFPFDIKNIIENIPNLEDAINFHNETMGIMFSTYEILDETPINE